MTAETTEQGETPRDTKDGVLGRQRPPQRARRILPLGSDDEIRWMHLAAQRQIHAILDDTAACGQTPTTSGWHTDHTQKLPPCGPCLRALGWHSRGVTAVDHGRISHLSARQAEILYLISNGLTQREVGEHLKIKIDTVNIHMRRTMRALDSRNSTHAAATALRLGLIN